MKSLMMRIPRDKVIKLSKDAAKALKLKGPSDENLHAFLNAAEVEDNINPYHIRWMAAHILEMNGYKLEES